MKRKIALLDPLSRAIALIESRTGLAVGSLLRNDMSHVIDRLSGGDLALWVRRLENSPEDSPVWQTLIASFTIGETYFMRDPLHFKLLREMMLPPLILQRRQEKRLQLGIWSVGCATGEEPYSIAIALQEFLPDIDRWQLNIVATDINAQALDHARKGVYRAWSFRHTNDTFVRRYFTRKDDTYELRPDIKDMVRFVRGNLLQPPDLPTFDFIFCRNILLYFTTRHVEQAEETLYQSLNKNGWLILGSAEALRSKRERWQVHVVPNAPIYQKSAKRITQQMKAITITQANTSSLVEASPPVVLDCSAVVEAIRMGENDHAERTLGTMLAQAPHDARANTLLAFIFANRKAYPEALAHLDSAVKADPTYGDAYYLRAVILNEQGKVDDVGRGLQAALYYQRDHLLAMLLMGTLHLQTGDIPKAHKIWGRGRDIALKQSAEANISDFSEMTVGQYISLLNSQLDS
jgi:chemotaxis protein methyltransferase CheR